MAFLLGTKVKMSQVWKDEKVIPVTLVHAAPNTVSVVRTKDKDGYDAFQLRLGKRRKEFTRGTSTTSQSELPELKKGDTVDVSVFKEGDVVRVSGLSKGRGFQGVVKRHGFHGGPKTHGQKNRLRAPGSIGSTAFQRVVPGRRMAGRMGHARVTLKNVKVVSVDRENNLIALKGAVPGAPGTLVEIRV